MKFNAEKCKVMHIGHYFATKYLLYERRFNKERIGVGTTGERFGCNNHIRPEMIPGLFVPLHFRSRERKDHRENFRSRGTVVPWNIRSLELSLLWKFRSSGAKVPRTFVPWNIRSRGTFVPRQRTFQELSFLWNCIIMRTNISRTFATNVIKHGL